MIVRYWRQGVSGKWKGEGVGVVASNCRLGVSWSNYGLVGGDVGREFVVVEALAEISRVPILILQRPIEKTSDTCR